VQRCGRLGLVKYAFEGMELDIAAFELRRGATSIPMEPQVFDVHCYLVQHRDRVVPKEELMDQLWGGRFVSETAVTSRIKQARRALGDDGQAQRLIKTLHGRGYRFVAPTREGEDGSSPPTASGQLEPALSRRPLPVHYTTSDGLSIAYQVTGGGELDIVLISGFASHLDLDWGDPRHAHFLDRLGRLGRLGLSRRRGVVGVTEQRRLAQVLPARRHRRGPGLLLRLRLGRGRRPAGPPDEIQQGGDRHLQREHHPQEHRDVAAHRADATRVSPTGTGSVGFRL
jgi:DNA-binding winged helix-turn-helix (wHTH) protein